MTKALFILKRREDYNDNSEGYSSCQEVTTGMYNSAKFMSDALIASGIESKLVTVVDNNAIDKEVHDYRPTHVFIEGYWVVPDKFDVLKKLHSSVKWIVRCHSELPFLSQEGIAIDWTFEYLKRGLLVAGNNPRINEEIRIMAHQYFHLSAENIARMIPLLPNYYPVTWHHHEKEHHHDNEVINIGCFGAIRPLKNQLLQAVAAIDFATHHNKKLRFHINAGRVEMNGANPLKNLRALFAHIDHELIEHEWTRHQDFLDIISKMDICMQVSFSETFNIVSADAVNMRRAIVVSKEVGWAYPLFAEPTESKDITAKMHEIWKNKEFYIAANVERLKHFSVESVKHWLRFLEV